MTRSAFLLFLLFAGSVLQAQVSHFIYVHEAGALNKQISMGGYAIGFNRVIISANYGIAKGTDYQFLSADKLNDNKAQGQVNGSQTVEPSPYPTGMYLEECDSRYSGNQYRLGFTAFIRRNDTLGRHAFTGPHIGLDAVYMTISEDQHITYKSETDDTRLHYSGIHNFNAVGAATHVGWQFAFFKDHLYLDLRAVVPFYYPFMEDPNLNSPFAGTKYEFQAGLAWRFGKRQEKEDEVKDAGKGKVRDKI